jgi:hypothetical protein
LKQITPQSTFYKQTEEEIKLLCQFVKKSQEFLVGIYIGFYPDIGRLIPPRKKSDVVSHPASTPFLIAFSVGLFLVGMGRSKTPKTNRAFCFVLFCFSAPAPLALLRSLPMPLPLPPPVLLPLLFDTTSYQQQPHQRGRQPSATNHVLTGCSGALLAVAGC